MDEARIEDIPLSDIPPTPETVEEDIEIVMEKVKTEEAFRDEATDPGQDNTVALLVGVAVGILTLILIFIYTRRRSLGRGEKNTIPFNIDFIEQNENQKYTTEKSMTEFTSFTSTPLCDVMCSRLSPSMLQRF